VAIAVVVALIVFLLGGGGGSSKAATPTTTTPPVPTTTTPTTTTTTPTTTTTTTGGGGCSTLQSCLPPTVENGTFSLDRGSVQKDTSLIANGATDAIDAKYFDTNNNEVDVFLAAFPDSSSLQKQVTTSVNNLGNGGCNQTSTGSFTSSRGNQFTTADFDCSGSSQNISPAWTVAAGTSNGIFGLVAGPGAPSDAERFARALVLGQ
jgi:hypothetical protein